MKFKELFGSFTSYRDEKRTTGTHYGSNGNPRSENWRMRNREIVGEAPWKVPSAKITRIQTNKSSDRSQQQRGRRRRALRRQ
ncbi:hypothetical protein Hanom_Chr14g01313841 [Helianthus anomalus]